MTNPTSPIRISIDMETASTERNASILTLGAAQFGLPFGATVPQFYKRASLANNELVGRDVNPETMQWWDKQTQEERIEVFSGQGTLIELLDDFGTFCEYQYGDLKSIELWSRGAGFDCEILQDAYMDLYGHYPFDFRKHMCQRTIQNLMPEWLVNAVPVNTRKHHALSDAKYQADILDVALRNLSWNMAGASNG